MESFPKQTMRNRCIIVDPKGEQIVLSVPVKKVESKQYTRDIEISYQTKWQHQHWNAILSAYKRTPYFDYYQDFIRPLYERETRYLVDLNDATYAIVKALLTNTPPCDLLHPCEWKATDVLEKTNDWRSAQLETYLDGGISILDSLFKEGPMALVK